MKSLIFIFLIIGICSCEDSNSNNTNLNTSDLNSVSKDSIKIEPFDTTLPSDLKIYEESVKEILKNKKEVEDVFSKLDFSVYHPISFSIDTGSIRKADNNSVLLKIPTTKSLIINKNLSICIRRESNDIDFDIKKTNLYRYILRYKPKKYKGSYHLLFFKKEINDNWVYFIMSRADEDPAGL